MQNDTSLYLQINVGGNNKGIKRSWEMLMSCVTDDLWTEILLRLPLESLLLFKSVSKSWFAIISSNRFAKSHLDRAIASGEDDEILIVHLDLYEDEDEEEHDGSFSLFDLGQGYMLENLKFPFSQGEYRNQPISCLLLGCVCGIVCVYVDLSDLPAANKEFDIYLWNPANAQSKLISPHTILEAVMINNPAFGFGFDNIDLDFKLVKVIGRTFSAEVYSSNRNAWRKIEPKPVDVPRDLDFHVCLHGFLLTSGHKGLIAFDLNKEVFICDIELPTEPSCARITDFNDSISVSAYVELDNKVYLWTLESEACLQGGGVNASWTKILSVDVGVQLGWVAGLVNNDEFLLVEKGGEWLFYNFKNEDARKLHCPPYFGSSEILKCVLILHILNLIDDREVEDDYVAPSNSYESGIHYGASVSQTLELEICIRMLYNFFMEISFMVIRSFLQNLNVQGWHVFFHHIILETQYTSVLKIVLICFAPPKNKSWFGLCSHSPHVWLTQVYDFSKMEGQDKFQSNDPPGTDMTSTDPSLESAASTLRKHKPLKPRIEVWKHSDKFKNELGEEKGKV
ncbi:F-box domain-containing protein [Heracleum sosnowskyi]|uniref:F-box domain-containing protein n=1 Tax=Heracleum sosnowskyi TaxID=360622 RepID=A0AAD8N872_9APIA|nr:F-box domain-containing protein [Heracleum sosnowskyi]